MADKRHSRPVVAPKERRPDEQYQKMTKGMTRIILPVKWRHVRDEHNAGRVLHIDTEFCRQFMVAISVIAVDGQVLLNCTVDCEKSVKELAATIAADNRLHGLSKLHFS